MSDVYEYRTIRIARAGWPALARSAHEEIDPALHERGGSMVGLFAGLIGFASDEGVILSAWRDADALASSAAKLLDAAPGVVESTAERLMPTVRPLDSSPIVSDARGDVYAHRWFWLQPQDWPEFVSLSEEGVWPYFESDGCRIVGLWRSTEPGPFARALLITRYPSVAHWERTRLQSTDAPPGADTRLYAAARDAGGRRAALTERSIVRLTRLIVPNP
jgi:hypothetical protein